MFLLFSKKIRKDGTFIAFLRLKNKDVDQIKINIERKDVNLKKTVCLFLLLSLVFTCTSCGFELKSDAKKYPEYTVDTDPDILEAGTSLTMERVLKDEDVVLFEFTVTDEVYREIRYEYPDESLLEGKSESERDLLMRTLVKEHDYYYIPVKIDSQAFYPENIVTNEVAVYPGLMVFGESVEVGRRFLAVEWYYEDLFIHVTVDPRRLYYITDENTILPVCNETLLHDECIGLTVDEFKEYLTDMREKALAETDEVVEYYD